MSNYQCAFRVDGRYLNNNYPSKVVLDPTFQRLTDSEEWQQLEMNWLIFL